MFSYRHAFHAGNHADVPKHMGYAAQWFLLTALALFFAWRLRPRSRHAQEQ